MRARWPTHRRSTLDPEQLPDGRLAPPPSATPAVSPGLVAHADEGGVAAERVDLSRPGDEVADPAVAYQEQAALDGDEVGRRGGGEAVGAGHQ